MYSVVAPLTNGVEMDALGSLAKLAACGGSTPLADATVRKRLCHSC